jgi:hypothetical protein
MAARVIHFGPDDCHRLMVLRSAGYSVDDCGSLLQLRACLASGAIPDALLMSDGGPVMPEEAIALARTHVSLPVILFRNTTLTYEESGIDLVVPSLTPPEIWLIEVEGLIEKSRTLRTVSESLIDRSARHRREVADAVDRSRAERVRSKQERARNVRFQANPSILPNLGSK